MAGFALMLDMASVHKSKKVKEYLASNPDIKLIWLPKGSPHLNMIEQCWKTSKHSLLVSEYYAMFAIMNDAVSKYFMQKCSRTFDRLYLGFVYTP